MSLKRSMIFEEWVNMMNSKPWSVSSWVYWFEPPTELVLEQRKRDKSKEYFPEYFTIDYPLTTDSLGWAVKAAGGEVKSIDC